MLVESVKNCAHLQEDGQHHQFDKLSFVVIEIILKKLPNNKNLTFSSSIFRFFF